MDEAQDFDPRLIIITTHGLTGLALLCLLTRVSVQVHKRCNIRWDGFALIASWVSSPSVGAYSDEESRDRAVISNIHIDRFFS